MRSARARRLEPRDRGDAMRLAADFHNASVYRDYPLAFDKVESLVDRALGGGDTMAVVAADAVTDRMQGYLVGICYEHYFSNTLTVSDAGFYIDPEWRSMRIVRDMLGELEAWAWGKGAADIALGVSSGVADPQVVKLYERFGYARGVFMLVKRKRPV